MGSSVLVSVRVDATPERAFEVFTRDIASWWRPNGLFEFQRGKTGVLAFTPVEGGSFTETTADGEVFEIGRVRVWEPPRLLVFSWRQASFSPDQETEVHVRFEPAGEQTRVTVEHFGWEVIPQDHVARHTFPLPVFLQRHAEWWQTLLASYRSAAASSRP
jgi:uncharacterized protein YndB with AHSA1/START domain